MHVFVHFSRFCFLLTLSVISYIKNDKLQNNVRIAIVFSFCFSQNSGNGLLYPSLPLSQYVFWHPLPYGSDKKNEKKRKGKTMVNIAYQNMSVYVLDLCVYVWIEIDANNTSLWRWSFKIQETLAMDSKSLFFYTKYKKFIENMRKSLDKKNAEQNRVFTAQCRLHCCCLRHHFISAFYAGVH